MYHLLMFLALVLLYMVVTVAIILYQAFMAIEWDD